MKISSKRSAFCGLLVLAVAHAQTAPVSPSDSASSNPASETIKLEVFRVQTDEDTGYKVSTSTSATKFATPLKDIPQSIKIITADFLRDTISFSVSDAMRYVSNVSKRTTTHQPNTLIVRGFVVNNLFQDGFLVPDSNRDLANVARIEVIKGPASATIGRGEVGGAVNYVTKQPLRKAQATLDAVYGSFDFKRVVGDLTGPLNKSGSMRYRAIGVWQDNDGWRVHEHYRKQILYPSFSWDITDRTQLNVSAVALKTESPGTGAGIWITSKTAGNPPGLPEGPTDRDLDIGEKWDYRYDQDLSSLVSLIHSFNDVLSYRQGFVLGNRLSYFKRAQGSVRVSISPMSRDLIMSRNMISTDEDRDDLRTQGDLVAKYDLFGGQHSTLVGFEWARSQNDALSTIGSLTPINLTNPVYGALPTNVTVSSKVTNTNENFGFPFQHQSAFLNGRVKLTAGVRYDKAKQRTQFQHVVRADNVTPFGSYTASPRYGITLAPVKWATVYMVRSVDKQPVVTSNRYGLLPASDPRSLETFSGARNGTLDEAGVKSELFGGRVSLTAAVFRMTRANQVFNIIRTNPDGSIYNENFLSSGELVKGVEIEAFGQITPRLDFVLSVASSRATTAAPTGTLYLTSIPENSTSGFLTYRFHEKYQSGFSIFAGYSRIGRMWGTADNLFRLSAQDKADFGIGYSTRKLDYKIQATNVFDDYFIEAAPAATVIAWSAPRMIYASATYRF
jgi:iron complex outermembrane receptor protein